MAVAAEHHRLGAVSFLNARPLIWGLDDSPRLLEEFDCEVELRQAVPSQLASMIDENEVDAALVPIIDVVKPNRDWRILSNSCIGCDGETLTVRVFSRTMPEEIERLHVDGDSHTSVALAQLIWLEKFGRRLEIVPWEGSHSEDEAEAVLLIGDKVINSAPVEFDIQTDLGGAWKSLTGLPFVFAVWAARRDYPAGRLGEVLESARDEGVGRIDGIAAVDAPQLGWPVELARRYLAHRLRFTITERYVEAMRRFVELLKMHGLQTVVQEVSFG